jgi:ribonuclease P protein component
VQILRKFRLSGIMMSEQYVNQENLSAKEEASRTRSRLPQEDANRCRTCSAETPTSQRPQASISIIKAPIGESSVGVFALPMLERNARITSRKDFSKLFKAAKNFSTPTLLLKVRKTGSVTPSRFAFVVSTKVSKSAVVRNRIKRQLRAVVRSIRPQLISGLEVIFIAKPTSDTQTYTQLLGTTRDICKKADLFSNK